MPTDAETPAEPENLKENLAKMEELRGRLAAALRRRESHDAGLEGPGGDLYAKAAAAYVTEMMTNPAKIMERQVGYWGKALKHYADARDAMMEGFRAPEDDQPEDRRFGDELWRTHPFFNFVKQQYQMNAEAVRDIVAGMEGLDPGDKRRLEFFARQMIDMLSPSNFLATNPEALQRALDTDGRSLVRGMENLVRDIEENDGGLLVTLTDRDAFEVGGNLAATEGSVVFRNHMMELIQYAPRTERVRETPLLIFPPWINKYYILDLKPENSLIRWIVDQGYTLFVVSWVNPDASYGDVGMGDYVGDGFLKAIDVVRDIAGVEKINAVGYCIAGTTLSLTLALMRKRGVDTVNSATFFATLTDFSDRGEFGVFLDEDFVSGIEREVAEKGYLRSFFMSRTFSYLRPNDLIYRPAIRSYMLGEAPPAFDLLYWNGDSTNLPAKMVVEYLRGLCRDDRFAGGAGFDVMGETVKIGDVGVPLCAIACEADHIAAWRSSFNGIKKMGSRSKTFILSESGHIAGIVNPPSKKKYGHYSGPPPKKRATPEDWLGAAAFHEGSWWHRWEEWLRRKSGKLVEARGPGAEDYPEIAPAPGAYVVGGPDHRLPSESETREAAGPGGGAGAAR